MINSFNIKHVGSLNDVTAEKLGSTVLVYGENGAGKSTIASVLRSLQLGDAQTIEDRRPVGGEDDAEISFSTDDGDHNFASGKWDSPLSALSVFDQAFVNRNVHSGDLMDNDHGKSLYTVILGETSGELLDEAAALEEKVTEHNSAVRDIKNELESHVPRDVTLEQFIALPQSSSLEEDIRRQTERVDTLGKRKKLDRADGFTAIELPELSDSFEQVLKKTIGNFLDNAEQLVHEHIEKKTSGATLSWIEQGCVHLEDDNCPFCGESTKSSKLIAAYKGFFSREYNTLKAEINSLSGLIESAYGERVVVNQQKVLSENNAARQFWEDYIEVPPLDESVFEEIGDSIGRAREKLNDLADQKKQNPLDEVPLAVDLSFSSSLQERIDDYNTLVKVANERIEELRKAQSEGDINEETEKLAALKATGARYEPEVVSLIETWQGATEKKETLSKERKSLQKKIQKETKAVFADRGDRINQILESFGAGFGLGEFATNNRTKPPSVQIRVCFDGAEKAVKLDDKASKSERPFDAALSSGERNMLAFALFITSLSQDDDTSKKVIVIDDPITNLDQTRLTKTAEIVASVGDQSQQLIVLSHNNTFLDAVAKHSSSESAQRLQLTKDKDGTSLTEVK